MREPGRERDDEPGGAGRQQNPHDDDKDFQSAHPTPRRMMTGTSVMLTLERSATGERLDRALQTRLPELSRSRLKQLILSGQVSDNGNVIRDPARKVKAGQTFVVILP